MSLTAYHAKLFAHPLRTHRLSPISEGGSARYHQHARHSRQIGGKVLRDALHLGLGVQGAHGLVVDLSLQPPKSLQHLRSPLRQVEPVKDKAAYNEDNVDFMLTEIERQGKESNIIRASMFVRDGKRLPIREYSDVRVRAGEPPIDALIEHAGEDAQIICARNDTRRAINARVREALGPRSGRKQPAARRQLL